MFRNYLKVAWRNLIRNKAFSAINIVGLAFGLATCLLIGLYLLDELSYDRFNANADRMVRVVFRAVMNGGEINEASVMPPVAQTLKKDYPEVEAATRIRTAGAPAITVGTKTFRDDQLAYVDTNFFQVFSLPLVQGDAKTVLSQPNTAVISADLARKYFGNANPVGRLLTIKSWNTLVRITGVIEKVPTNAHFHFDLFLSMAGVAEANSTSWMTSNFYTYLVLAKGYDPKQLEAKLPQTVSTYMGPQVQQAFGMSMAQFSQKGNRLSLRLQPLTDIHLHSNLTSELEANGDSQYVYIFGAIALFMLLIACINFMNLSTAGASKRAREVGVRKVMGSARQSLTNQFLIESLLLTMVALVLAVGIVWLVLPLFNELAGKTLALQIGDAGWLLPMLLLLGLLVGVLAGSYPAFFLSSFKPITVLNGGQRAGNQGSLGLRSGLVVVQFFISIILTIGTTVVYQQLNYIQHKKLGYTKEQVLVLPDAWQLGQKATVFRDQILRDPRVANASMSGYLPAGPSNTNNYLMHPGSNPTQLIKAIRYDVDYAYIPTLGMQLAAGRNFSKAYGTDSSGVILNETAARILGWDGNAIGKTIGHTESDDTQKTYTVIGVVKDFHFRSLHEAIAPLVMALTPDQGTLIVKVKTDDVAGLLASLKTEWENLATDTPFTYSFLDRRYNETYLAEQKTGRILGIFAGLTIFVACLGLFGLAAFTAEQRTKEIGVRKVLGASVVSIITLLSRDFVKLVLIAIVIASPVAYYAMNRWLSNFAYRIDISWWVFVLAGLLAVSIALLTVSFQSIRAALVNPVKSLRSE
ncbi:ABC transporter permease [Spirosoma rhododendri]|uniref:FtsX-like permease family protein n=1 Tax=Spirosoma rhododendri TaxID=2728024 RepID=A0A7L5DN66_9BACT|nr:ABC transporter permease [Spirosoma rhododendri]QJD78653.1 FtsX-like permease family protein [Spirosoma rhododendri]